VAVNTKEGLSVAVYKSEEEVEEQEDTQHPFATGQLISSIHTRARAEGLVQELDEEDPALAPLWRFTALLE